MGRPRRGPWGALPPSTRAGGPDHLEIRARSLGDAAHLAALKPPTAPADPSTVSDISAWVRARWQRENPLLALAWPCVVTLDAASPHLCLHAARCAYDVEELSDRLGLAPVRREQAILAALLHNIGELGEAQRFTPAARAARAWVEVRSPTDAGERIVRALAESEPALEEVALAVRHHCEHWDGSGHPDGLAGEAIPFLARLIAPPAYVAATAIRREGRVFSDEQVRRFLRGAADVGRFDPEIAATYEALLAARGEEPEALAALHLPGARAHQHEQQEDELDGPPREVRARAATSHGLHDVSFDARAWLSRTNNIEITALARDGFASPAADRVAEWFAPRFPELEALLEHLAAKRRDANGMPVRLECALDEEDVRAWLTRERPYLLPILDGDAAFATARFHVIQEPPPALGWQVLETASGTRVDVTPDLETAQTLAEWLEANPMHAHHLYESFSFDVKIATAEHPDPPALSPDQEDPLGEADELRRPRA